MARMTKDAFAYFDGQRGYLTTVDGEGAVTEIMTVKASPPTRAAYDRAVAKARAL
ncbi:hypothetical protein SAMN05519104_4375 [Rhizobiales bacterium GAS188]|nr:hypothetical protein SAMN05519104_4375 [Rhizobiales bacterium GAS188]